MALKDLLKLSNPRLKERFNEKPYDPEKARVPFLKMIERTRRQFASTEPVRGRKSFVVRNGVVEFKPGISIAGQNDLFVDSGDFDKLLKGLEEVAKAGELDDALKSAVHPTRNSNKGWTPERRAQYQRTMAAKKSK